MRAQCSVIRLYKIEAKNTNTSINDKSTPNILSLKVTKTILFDIDASTLENLLICKSIIELIVSLRVKHLHNLPTPNKIFLINWSL